MEVEVRREDAAGGAPMERMISLRNVNRPKKMVTLPAEPPRPPPPPKLLASDTASSTLSEMSELSENDTSFAITSSTAAISRLAASKAGIAAQKTRGDALWSRARFSVAGASAMKAASGDARANGGGLAPARAGPGRFARHQPPPAPLKAESSGSLEEGSLSVLQIAAAAANRRTSTPAGSGGFARDEEEGGAAEEEEDTEQQADSNARRDIWFCKVACLLVLVPTAFVVW